MGRGRSRRGRHRPQGGSRAVCVGRHGGAGSDACRHRGGEDGSAGQQGSAGDGRSPDGRGGAAARRGDSPCRQRAQRDSPVRRWSGTGRRAAVHTHRIGRAVPGPADCRPRSGNARGRVTPSHVVDGAQDHHRLRDVDEQGARGHRGSVALRRVARSHRRRGPSPVGGALAGRAARRFADCSARGDGYAPSHPVRVFLPRALARPASRSRSDRVRTARLSCPRHGPVPVPRAGLPCVAVRSRAAGGAQRGERGGGCGVPGAPAAVHRYSAGDRNRPRSGGGSCSQPSRRHWPRSASWTPGPAPFRRRSLAVRIEDDA